MLLEEFISSKLECALEEVSSSSWAETSQESTSTFLSNNLSETSNETFVVCDGVELDSCLNAVRINVRAQFRYLELGNLGDRYLDARELEEGANLHIDGCEASVGDSTADCTSQGESRVESNTAELLGGVGGDLLNRGIELGRAGGCAGRSHRRYLGV